MIEASRFEPSGVPLLASCLARIWACAASAARGRSLALRASTYSRTLNQRTRTVGPGASDADGESKYCTAGFLGSLHV